MALIRGFRGKCPCPICLIEGDKLSDLHHVAQERTTAATYVKVTRTYTTEAAKENALKAEGLRPVIVSIITVVASQLLIYLLIECFLDDGQYLHL